MTGNPEAKLSKVRSRTIYRKLALIRRFEEKVDELFKQGIIKGAIHVSVGEEAVAVGVAEAIGELATTFDEANLELEKMAEDLRRYANEKNKEA